MIAIIAGRLAQFLLALAMIRVATTLLSPEEMGKVSLTLTSIAFFAMFLINPVGMFINRRLHAWQASGMAKPYLIRYAGYLLLVAFIAAINISMLQMSGLISFGISTSWLILLACGSIFFNTINQTAIPSLNMLGYSGRFIFLTVASVAASFVCAVSLVQAFQPAAEYWLLGLLLGQTLLAVIGVKVLFARLQKVVDQRSSEISRRHIRILFNFGWPVAVAAGLAWVQSQGYRYFMEDQLGLAQLGLFVAGYGISAGMIAGFESILASYFQPRLYREVSGGHANEQAEAWHRYATAVIPSLILTTALIAMLAPELTRLFLGGRYQAAADLVVWGVIAEAARVLAGVYSLIAHVNMKTYWLIIPNTVGAAFSVVLCLLLIPIAGAAGVGMGLAISGFASVLAMHILLIRNVGGGISLRPVFMAMISAILLWGVALEGRQLFNISGWSGLVGMLAMVGSMYLAMQYWLLWRHLEEKRE